MRVAGSPVFRHSVGLGCCVSAAPRCAVGPGGVHFAVMTALQRQRPADHVRLAAHQTSADALHLSPEGRDRLAWMLLFARYGSVDDTCVEFGIAPSTFRRWWKRFDPDDLTTLEERSHKPFALRRSAVPAAVVESIRAYRRASPLVSKGGPSQG